MQGYISPNSTGLPDVFTKRSCHGNASVYIKEKKDMNSHENIRRVCVQTCILYLQVYDPQKNIKTLQTHMSMCRCMPHHPIHFLLFNKKRPFFFFCFPILFQSI